MSIVLTVGSGSEAPPRYASVNHAWPETIPPCSRIEAERAARKIWRKFAKSKYPPRTRRCWINPHPMKRSSYPNGWWRLAHDLSHDIFWRTYRGTRRPHDPLHEHYEQRIVDYVLAAGWLEGKLKPKAKAKVKPTLDEKRAVEARRVEAAIARWTSKEKRAQTALRKLRKKQRRLAKLVG